MDGIKNNIVVNDKGIHGNVKDSFAGVETVDIGDGVRVSNPYIYLGSANESYTYSTTSQWVRNVSVNDRERFVCFFICDFIAKEDVVGELYLEYSETPIEDVESWFNENVPSWTIFGSLPKRQITDTLWWHRIRGRSAYDSTKVFPNNYTYIILSANGKYLKHVVLNPI